MKPNAIYQKLRSLGWSLHRQGKGTHQIWRRGSEQVTVSAKNLDRNPRGLQNFLNQIN